MKLSLPSDSGEVITENFFKRNPIEIEIPTLKNKYSSYESNEGSIVNNQDFNNNNTSESFSEKEFLKAILLHHQF